MTTVAYRNGVMAADSGEFSHGEVRSGAVKVFNTGKYLGGIVGNLHDLRPYFDWITDIQDDHKNPTTFYRDTEKGFLDETESSILLANSGGEIWLLTGTYASPRPYEFDTVGSGSDFAMAALHCEKSAVEAVNTAIHYNHYSRGPITYTSFDHAITDFDSPLTGPQEPANQYTVVG